MRREVFEVNEEGYGDRSYIVFDSPRDIDGTALLFSYPHLGSR